MAQLLSVFGYKGDPMGLPVADVDGAVQFYVDKMGFKLAEIRDEPVKTAVLERDGIRIAIGENGGDPEQDGCGFHTDDIVALHAEFTANGFTPGDINLENRKDGSKFKAFFAIAPDGLCYWFGERQ